MERYMRKLLGQPREGQDFILKAIGSHGNIKQLSDWIGKALLKTKFL